MLLDGIPKSHVISQGIKIVLIESRFSTRINAIERCCFAKVAFDGCHSLVYQTSNLVLVPLHGNRIGKVEHCILIRHSAHGVFNLHPAFYQFLEISILWCKIRKLPQTGMETVLFQRLQHGDWVGETVLGKFIVALPINPKPSRVEMDDIGGNAMRPKLFGNFQSFLLRKICYPAHPCAKGP